MYIMNKTYHTSRCNVQRCDLAADSITCCMSCKCITDTHLFDIGARCKYKTGRYSREIGDRSRCATLSSHEIGRPWLDRFQTAVFCVCHAHLKGCVCCFYVLSFAGFIVDNVVECDVWKYYLWLFPTCFVVVVFFLCLWECDRMLHWIGPVPWKWNTCLQDRSCIGSVPHPARLSL